MYYSYYNNLALVPVPYYKYEQYVQVEGSVSDIQLNAVAYRTFLHMSHLTVYTTHRYKHSNVTCILLQTTKMWYWLQLPYCLLYPWPTVLFELLVYTIIDLYSCISALLRSVDQAHYQPKRVWIPAPFRWALGLALVLHVCLHGPQQLFALVGALRLACGVAVALS